MIRKLLNLNGIAVIGVVLNHAIGWSFVAMFWWAHRYRPVASPNFDLLNSPSYYGLRIIEQLITFSIPAFLFVSGYFIIFASGRNRDNLDWGYILSRVRNLVIPYLLWSLVMMGAEAIEGASYSPVQFARTLLLGQATPAFYFVPLIVQLYFGSKLFLRWAQRNWIATLAVVGLLQITVHVVRYLLILTPGVSKLTFLTTLTAGWFFPSNVFWFVLGIVIGMKNTELMKLVRKYRKLWVFAAVLFAVAGVLEWNVLLSASGESWIAPQETLIDNFYSIAVLLAWLAYQFNPGRVEKWLNALGARSYGVYLVHSLLLIASARLIYHFAPNVLGLTWLFVPILFTIGLGGSLLLLAFVRATPVRRAYEYLFG